MNRTYDIHPDRYGRGHVCSAHAPAGEHRSYPLTVDTDAGRGRDPGPDPGRM